MGYYTKYEIQFFSGDKELNFAEADAIFGDPEFDIGYSLDDYASDNEDLGPFSVGGDDIKWYDHDKDVMKISVKHPELTIILDGKGEESGDIWRKFFRNGKSYSWKPQIDPPTIKDVEKFLK